MPIIQVKPGADPHAIEDMARHMNLTVCRQGNFTVLLTPQALKQQEKADVQRTLRS